MRGAWCTLSTAWFLVTATALMGGCGLSKVENAPLASQSKKSASGKEGFLKTVYPYVRSNCVECHGGNRTPLFAHSNADTAYAIAYTLVNFSEIPASKFVLKVKDGHCGGNCSTDGSAMIQLIAQWKTYFDSKAVLPGAPVPKGNVFTASLPVPVASAAYKSKCILPEGLKGSPDVTTPITVTDPSGNPVTVQSNSCWIKLRYPFSAMTPARDARLARAWFEVDFAYGNYASELGVASYVYKNPRVVSPDFPVYVHDIKTFINGDYRPQYGEAYLKVDTVVDVAQFSSNGANVCNSPPAFPIPFAPTSIGATCVPGTQSLFSSAASATGIVQETDNDTIGFSFEYLQEGVSGDCKDLATFQAKVYNPIKIGAVACLNCHKAGGDVSEAGQRFNMDINDTANGADLNARWATVCRRFLQRSNLDVPDSSPILVQPRQGLNGMPAQANFGLFAPDWLSWITSERAKAGK